MAHWGMKPKEVGELSEDDLEALEYSFLLYERRQAETLSDIIGSLTGTSWPVEALLNEGNKDLEKPQFTWSLRPPRNRISSPLTLVMAGSQLIKELKKQASAINLKHRENPAILSRPRNLIKKDEKIEIIELGTKSKEEFLGFIRAHNLG